MSLSGKLIEEFTIRRPRGNKSRLLVIPAERVSYCYFIHVCVDEWLDLMFCDSTPAVTKVTLSIRTDNTRSLTTILSQHRNGYCICVSFARSRKNNRNLVWRFVTGSRKSDDILEGIFHTFLGSTEAAFIY